MVYSSISFTSSDKTHMDLLNIDNIKHQSAGGKEKQFFRQRATVYFLSSVNNVTKHPFGDFLVYIISQRLIHVYPLWYREI